ncbi:glycerate kinase [Spirochaetia bacterium 38H-sp]|uniref:Glycerate kinase n=1 Tax=Rarispira pelagica TaxID=3141764 RepID=A0ABU9UCH2_9SPIR
MQRKKYIMHLKDIAAAGVRAVYPDRLVESSLSFDGRYIKIGNHKEKRIYDTKKYKKIYLFAAGKAAASMAKTAERILSGNITEGLVVTKYGHSEKLGICNIIEAGHPVPDENSFKAGKMALDMARKADEECLFISLISGGASSLLCVPYFDEEGRTISLEDKKKVTDLLLFCGADIEEINTVRKHLSMIKGGRLAKEIYPATGVHLVLSDVVGDRMDMIASGPTVPDSTNFSDVLAVVKKYNLTEKIPDSVASLINAGIYGTVKKDTDENAFYFLRNFTIIIGNNNIALEKAESKAKELGYNTLILSSSIEGEAREIAKVYLAIAEEIVKYARPVMPPCCILVGGEPTVRIEGTGKGGRNQELALAFLANMKKSTLPDDKAFFLSAATDGNDGPTNAAGAFASSDILKKACSKGLNPSAYLANNDSYNFFLHLDALYKTGPTNTNVCDLHILIVL